MFEIKGYKTIGEEICNIGNQTAYVACALIRKKVASGLQSGKCCLFCCCCFSVFVFCFSVSKPHSEVHVPHSDTVNVTSVVLLWSHFIL